MSPGWTRWISSWRAVLVLSAVLLASMPSAAWSGLGKPALDGERLGLHNGEAFRLTTGRCGACPMSAAARWYFHDELIAAPEHGGRFSPFVWIGAPEIVAEALLARDAHGGLVLTVGDDSAPLRLVPKIPANRSYYDASTTDYFLGRSLRIRGKTELRNGMRTYVARTIWPHDFNLTPASLALEPLGGDRALERLIMGQMESLRAPLYQRLLWRRMPDAGRDWAGRPALAFVLSGAQGDDDDAHWGHLAAATGILGPRGEWADWLVYNFYPLDKVSEKGIVTAMVPMDNYLADLNQGQNYYRPGYLTIAVLRDDRVPRAVGTALRQVMHQTYCHLVEYDHATMNSTSKTIDALRAAGWQVPESGRTGLVKAVGAFLYVAATQWNFGQAADLFRALTQDRTRILPRAAFESLSLDLLRMVEEERQEPPRRWTELERMLVDDVEAVLFVRVPQIPSGRVFGTYPVASFESYLYRVPSDPAQWERIDAPHREFPEHLRESCLAGS